MFPQQLVRKNRLRYKLTNSNQELNMDKERFERGLAARKSVLGAEYVEKALKNADDFNREFQEQLTEFCWGSCWGNETLNRQQRSLLNLGMIAALNRMNEWEIHFRGAITNGITREELKSILLQISVYLSLIHI